MDNADRAQILEEGEREEALRRLRDSTAYCEAQIKIPHPTRSRGGGGEMVVICRECLDPIQEERLRAYSKAVRCIDCQIEHEREQQQERLYAD
jgi:RNA polymerase-binding transcription factor DksA